MNSITRAGGCAAALLIALAGGRAQEPAAAPEPPPTAPAAAGMPTIDQEGQTFALANRTSSGNVETDEYLLPGEKIADWTQLVTVQRITLTRATGADEFVAYFQKRVAEDGASLEVLRQAKTASVFAVRFPRSERNEEQVMVCLAVNDPGTPTRLNIVQYAIKPTRCAVTAVETQIKTWRDKFLRQAAGLAR